MAAQLPPKETRVHYYRLVDQTSPLREFDQCLDCMVRNYQTRIGDDGVERAADAMARGRLIIDFIAPYPEGMGCTRCIAHMKFVSFTDKLLGEET
jgi:hypothetical protein